MQTSSVKRSSNFCCSKLYKKNLLFLSSWNISWHLSINFDSCCFL